MRELFLISFLGMLITVSSMYLISHFMGLGVSGIAWGIFIGASFVMLSTAVVVHKYYSIFDFHALIRSAAKAIVAVIIMSLVIEAILLVTIGGSKLMDLLLIALSTIVGGIVYAVILRLLGHQEFNSVLRIVIKRFTRPLKKD